MAWAGDISPALGLVAVFRTPTVFASGGWVSEAGVTDAGSNDAGRMIIRPYLGRAMGPGDVVRLKWGEACLARTVRASTPTQP